MKLNIAIIVVLIAMSGISDPCLASQYHGFKTVVTSMVESSLNLTLRDAPMGCLQNAFCLAGQRMIEPEGKGLGKLLDGLETTAKVLREVSKEDINVPVARNLSLAYNIGLSDGGRDVHLCHDIFSCKDNEQRSGIITQRDRGGHDNCKITNKRICPVVGIGCAFCRFFLRNTCSRRCFATEVFCHSAWIGCTMDNQEDRRSLGLTEEMNCLKQTFCLAGAQGEETARTGRHLFRDITKWNEIKQNVWKVAKVFQRILKISDKKGKSQYHSMRELVSSFDLGVRNKDDLKICETRYPCTKDILDLKISPVY